MGQWDSGTVGQWAAVAGFGCSGRLWSMWLIGTCWRVVDATEVEVRFNARWQTGDRIDMIGSDGTDSCWQFPDASKGRLRAHNLSRSEARNRKVRCAQWACVEIMVYIRHTDLRGLAN